LPHSPALNTALFSRSRAPKRFTSRNQAFARRSGICELGEIGQRISRAIPAFREIAEVDRLRLTGIAERRKAPEIGRQYFEFVSPQNNRSCFNCFAHVISR
jgi:hypothetical protein